MLSSHVSIETHPRLKHPTMDASPERASRAEGVFSAARPPRFPLLSTPSRISCTLTPAHYPCKSFRMNTCESGSKQPSLTSFRINTYEKQRRTGMLLLPKNPNRDSYHS